MPPVYVTGAQKYVEFSPGHAIVNGVVLYINETIRIDDSELTDAPGGTGYGDYYVYLAPNRLIMESYYSKNWQIIIKSTTAAGPLPPTNSDEFMIAKITKTDDGSGNSVLACTELNRGARLIGTKDISDYALKAQHFNETVTYGLRAQKEVTGGGTITHASNRIKWSERFVVISQGKSSGTATGGYFDITMPPVGTVIPGIGATASDTVTSDGIQLGGWVALYYILPLGSGTASVNTNFRLAKYNDLSDADIPPHWVRVALDNSDIPLVYMADGRALRRDTNTFPLTITTASLPASPVNGQEIYYVADATNGIVWHFKYRSASASTYKWEYVGGTSGFNEVATSETTTSTTYTNLATTGPSFTVPLAGDYLIEFGAGIEVSGTTGNTDAMMSFAVGATAASDNDRIIHANTGTSGWNFKTQMRTVRKTDIAASSAIVAKYRNSTAWTAGYTTRWMKVTPIRVG